MPQSTIMLDGDYDLLNINPDGSINVKVIDPVEANGAIPINIQDQTSLMLDLYFIKPLSNATTLKAATTEDTYTLQLNDTTGFVDGVYVGVFCATGQYHFGHQIGAPVGDTVTIDTPFGESLPIGCNVLNLATNMAIDGTAGVGGREIFQIGPVGVGTAIEIDITRIHGVITDNLAMDDSKFGGIAALAKGCVLRKNNSGYINYTNFKSNGEISLYSGETLNYTDKAGGGEYSMNFKFPFSGPENHGVTVRLESGDILEMIIQDDLSDLSSFRMMAQGHFVTG